MSENCLGSLDSMTGMVSKTYVRPDTFEVVVETEGGECPNFAVTPMQLRNMVYAYFRYLSQLEIKTVATLPNGEKIEMFDDSPIAAALEKALMELGEAANIPPQALKAIMCKPLHD